MLSREENSFVDGGKISRKTFECCLERQIFKCFGGLLGQREIYFQSTSQVKRILPILDFYFL